MNIKRNNNTPLLLTLTLALAIVLLLLLSPQARAAVTDKDLASLNLTDAASAKTNAPADLSLPWVLSHLAWALGLVFGLMWLVLWAAKKYMPQGARNVRGGLIEVLGTRPIGQRRSLMLVRTQGKTLLLGVTPQSIQTLSEMEPETNTTWQDAALEAGLPPDKP